MEQAIVDATRIAAGDDRKTYDGLSMSLHWTTALLVVTLWGLSQIWGFWPRGSDPRHTLQHLHISLGVILALVLAGRIAWRLSYGRHPSAAPTFVERGAKGVHLLLYALLAVQVALGVLYNWGGNEPVLFFGLALLPPPQHFTPAQNNLFGTLHWWVGTAIVVIAALHAAAALVHHLALRDDVLTRMLPIRPRGRRASAAVRT